MIRSLILFLISGHLSAATILFIGDSHAVGPFGNYFDQHLREAGHVVATYASCGSIPKWWSSGQGTTCGFFSKDQRGQEFQAKTHKTPKLDDLLMELKPDAVVMEFGANYFQSSDAFIKKDVRQIIGKIKDFGSSCYWITHPDSRRLKEYQARLSTLLKEAVGEDCPIFDSTLVTAYPKIGGDGIHYGFKEGFPIARKWAELVFKAFIF